MKPPGPKKEDPRGALAWLTAATIFALGFAFVSDLV